VVVDVVLWEDYLVTREVIWGTRWQICLMHCATRQKIADPIPDNVLGFFLFITSCPGVDSASNREMKILKLQSLRTLRACPGI
jgi:hypothetical protein